MLALVYCNFFEEVRLGGWGTEGTKSFSGKLPEFDSLLLDGGNNS